MTDNIIPLADYRRGSFLGTCDLYRMPDGSISVCIKDMAAWEIEAKETIAERLTVFAGWMRQGADDLERQAVEWDENERIGQ